MFDSKKPIVSFGNAFIIIETLQTILQDIIIHTKTDHEEYQTVQLANCLVVSIVR